MQKRSFMMSIALILLLTGGVSRAEDKQLKFTSSYSGSGVDGDIDTNGDGIPAAVFTGIGNSNLGRFIFTGEGEFGEPVNNTTCPTGTLEYPLVQNTNVFFFQATGEQLNFTYTPGAVGCFDPVAFEFTWRLPGVFNGGTGRFAHATGVFEDDGVATYPAKDSNVYTYNAFVGTITGTLKGVKGSKDSQD